MGFDIYRDETGYILFLSPPLVPVERVETGLSRREVQQRLRQVRDKDIRPDSRLDFEVFSFADDCYKRGWTPVMLEIRHIRSRAVAGRSTPEDVAFVQRYRADLDFPYSDGHLRDTLRLLAASEKAQGRETAPPPTW